jgi:hypothetical protein
MTDGARGDSAPAVCATGVAQRRVPFLDVERSQLLENFLTEIRRDLISQQLPITVGCSGRDRAGALPLIDAGFNEVGNRYFVGRHMFSGISGTEQAPQFFSGFFEGAVECFGILFSVFLLADAIAQTKSVFAAWVDATVTV